MTLINGNAIWGINPKDSNGSQLSYMTQEFRNNILKSANDQLRYEIVWDGRFEGREPYLEGDVVNVIFEVQVRMSVNFNWNTIGVIRKSRDIVNRKYNNGNAPNGHRFTVDVSQLVADQLSYSLCPINKGTWQSNLLGGMNGGITMQDNVINKDGNTGGSAISLYNISDNGTFRQLRVGASFEIIGSNANNGALEKATNNEMYSEIISVINSVNQFEKDSVYYEEFLFNESDLLTYRFLSRCPNVLDASSINYDFKKPVREDEEAEFLQFYIEDGRAQNMPGSTAVGAMGLKVETFLKNGSAENTFYLRDFEGNARTSLDSDGSEYISHEQNQIFIQNVSPSYINNTAALKTPSNKSIVAFPYWTAYAGNKITASTSYYRVSLYKFGLYGPYAERLQSKYSVYTIDRESKNIPYGFVRFHWLNSMGGTDSYTAKRDVVEGLTISRDVVDKKSGDRTWYQANKNNNGDVSPNTSYYSDTMRGGDIYKGGREVTNVNAERVQSVYTEPLNKYVAKWLEEIMLSPNVWIEMDTDATKMGNTRNPYLRPSSKEYIPVIITNSDIETVNQSEGLVKLNIEYTLSHKVITQRN